MKASYDVTDEIPPSEPYFDPAFQEALKKGTQLAGSIAETLGRSGLAHTVGSDLHKIYSTAKDLEGFQSPATRTIGIVGDSAAGNHARCLPLTTPARWAKPAAGKSSLINSLLDQPGLAHKVHVPASHVSAHN